jgi:PAN domain
MERPIISLAVSIMIFSFSPAHAFTLFVENGIDRPGCDFKNFDLPGVDVGNSPQTSSVCANACGLDTNCQGWSFDAPPIPGTGRCFLKNAICAPTVRATPLNGSIGGVKLQATMSGVENEIDRPGCDFSNFPAVNPTTHAIDPQLCMFVCAEDNRCQAWNFDPRVGSGTCFLKNCVPPPTVPASTSVKSGVKFAPPTIAHAPPTTK